MAGEAGRLAGRVTQEFSDFCPEFLLHEWAKTNLNVPDHALLIDQNLHWDGITLIALRHFSFAIKKDQRTDIPHFHIIVYLFCGFLEVDRKK